MAPARPKTRPARRRPAFLEQLSEAYNLRRKSVVQLTGDVHGLFWSSARQDFVGLEALLHAELGPKFNLVRMDVASGVTFFDEATEAEVIRICESPDGKEVPRSRDRLMKNLIERSKHSPLAALVLLHGMIDGSHRARAAGETAKPICAVLQYAGALFPAGDFARLSELDRQRLVQFLHWVADPSFLEGPDLLLLINPVKSEINGKITALPATAHIEIQLPQIDERRSFVEHYRQRHPGLRFEGGRERFVRDSAGLTLANVKDLLEVAWRSKSMVGRDDVVREVNRLLEAELGEVIRIKYPQHGPEDVIGQQATGEIFRAIFARCDDAETAVSAILVSGPNGGGKTYQLEAYAAASGRVVVELAGIRGALFGETDKLFELLRWHIATFGKILILVDEAHTAFGSIHAGDVHKTERRLAGNIIKMMGDPAFLGKVLWGLMTSRPDELDPDIKSRSPIQVPIFDLEGDERTAFVAEMFRRKRMPLPPPELEQVVAATDYYSARDYRNLVAEVLAARRQQPEITVTEVLERWQASRSIGRERQLQTLIAAMHCSYPQLLPAPLRAMTESELAARVEQLKLSLAR
ncbi:MAG: AAA family ATPase [Acidobacteria bacterium]|nr:MAG: AAA family ATPase [Acidobacteriota bacterium]